MTHVHHICNCKNGKHIKKVKHIEIFPSRSDCEICKD